MKTPLTAGSTVTVCLRPKKIYSANGYPAGTNFLDGVQQPAHGTYGVVKVVLRRRSYGRPVLVELLYTPSVEDARRTRTIYLVSASSRWLLCFSLIIVTY